MGMRVSRAERTKNARRPKNWHGHFRPQNCGWKNYGHEAFSERNVLHLARKRSQTYCKSNCFRELFCNNFGQDGNRGTKVPPQPSLQCVSKHFTFIDRQKDYLPDSCSRLIIISNSMGFCHTREIPGELILNDLAKLPC